MKTLRWTRALAVAGYGLAIIAASLASATQASAGSYSRPGFCIPIMNAPVAMAQGQPFNQKISVTYCQPHKWAKGAHQVDVLTAGAGYTGSYWDWPQNPSLYSYVNKTLGQGRAAVTYDRVGSGASSKPLSTDVTLASDAYVLHQIVQVLRAGGYGFQRINSIGHSYGSGVVIHEAATYKDVSTVVLTGYLHNPRNPIVSTRNYPANQDPLFAASGLDNDYLTSKPNTRGLSFYSSLADPQVIAYDEAHKDIVSRNAFIGYAVQQGTPAGSNTSNAITVPVLEIVGQQDVIFCSDPVVLDCANAAAVQAYETPFFAPGKLTTAAVPGTGHDIALHPNANQSFQTINNWIKTH